MVLSVFMVAEKPSLAQSIAQILSDHKCSPPRKGLNGACNVQEWNGQFKGSPARFKMTSVCGHVFSLDFFQKFNDWDKTDPVELFSCQAEKKEANPKLKMPNFLGHEAKGYDILVLWLDCDKEGENICFEVIDCVSEYMKGKRTPQNIFRAHFSSITERDIKAAMDNLGSPDEDKSKSVDARQELDLRIGCAFTRFQTKFFQGKYGDLDASLISYGPCQTPTLGFCVDRHDKIQTFKSEQFWVLQTTVQTSGDNSRTYDLEWDRGRVFEKEVAQMFLQRVKMFDQADVVNITVKEKAKEKPIALNTVELMRVASSGLGMSPHSAMVLAEKLYTQGYISYPRTESTHYAESFDLKEVLRQQQNHPDWGSGVRALLSNGFKMPRKGTDAGDHPPITPMRYATKDELDYDCWRIYDYVVRHFIGTVAQNCKYQSTTIFFTIGDEKFTLSGKKLLDPGYTAFMTWQALDEDESVPSVQPGSFLSIKDVKLSERQTSPPDYLSEADLITLMEKHGIGTDASIPVHINNICIRNYVTVTANRRLVPTNLGVVLVHGYQKIDRDLVHPKMRSAVEEQLDLIALGKANFRSVLKHTLDVFKMKFLYFVKNIGDMDQLFEVSFSSLADSGKPLSRCGKCKRFTKYVQAKPSRLYCKQCDETYALPQNGNIREYQPFTCPLDDFAMLYFSSGVKGKGYVFCPYCYNHPPFKSMKKGNACNLCTHPSCPHGQLNLGVSACPECDGGVLVLDPASNPKWRLVCNKCDVVVKLFEDAVKVTINSDECCGECEAQLVKVKYGEGKTKLPDFKLTAEGCIYCDEELSKLVEKHHAVITRRRNIGGGGPAGRGRGGKRGGGAGRGKRRKAPKDKMSELDKYFV